MVEYDRQSWSIHFKHASYFDYVYADFEDMVWIPRNWMMKMTIDIDDEKEEFKLGIP